MLDAQATGSHEDMERRLPLWARIGLGATQIIGYGALYYAFSVLVPDIACDLKVSEKMVFGAFSVALLVRSFAAPVAGRLADRQDAGLVMGICVHQISTVSAEKMHAAP